MRALSDQEMFISARALTSLRAAHLVVILIAAGEYSWLLGPRIFYFLVGRDRAPTTHSHDRLVLEETNFRQFASS